jgi:hypothetical protein
MGRGIQECILYHINNHRAYWGKNPLILHDLNSYNAQRDAQYVLGEMLKCDFRNKEVGPKRFQEVTHNNPYRGGYSEEISNHAFDGSLDIQIQAMIWGFLFSKAGHKEALLNGGYTHAGVEIAHDNNVNLTILTVRLSRI